MGIVTARPVISQSNTVSLPTPHQTALLPESTTVVGHQPMSTAEPQLLLTQKTTVLTSSSLPNTAALIPTATSVPPDRGDHFSFANIVSKTYTCCTDQSTFSLQRSLILDHPIKTGLSGAVLILSESIIL